MGVKEGGGGRGGRARLRGGVAGRAEDSAAGLEGTWL